MKSATLSNWMRFAFMPFLFLIITLADANAQSISLKSSRYDEKSKKTTFVWEAKTVNSNQSNLSISTFNNDCLDQDDVDDVSDRSKNDGDDDKNYSSSHSEKSSKSKYRSSESDKRFSLTNYFASKSSSSDDDDDDDDDDDRPGPSAYYDSRSKIVEVTLVLNGEYRSKAISYSRSYKENGRSVFVTETIHVPVKVSFNGSHKICEGAELSSNDGGSHKNYSWKNDDDNSFTNSSSKFNPTKSGHYHVSYQDNDGCDVEEDHDVEYHENPKVDIEHDGDNSLCDGESIKLHAKHNGGGEKHSIKWSNGSESYEGEDHEVKPSVGKHRYSVRVEDEHGCASEIEETEIDVHENPRVEIEHDGDNSLCDGETIKLHAKHEGGGEKHSIKWSNGSESHEGEDHEVKPSVGKHHYTVRVEDEHGCASNEDGEDVDVHENPKGDIETDDNDLCDGESVKLKAKSEGGGEHHSYTWKRDNDSEEHAGESREEQPSVGEHRYKLTVRDEHGCASQEDEQVVNVHGRPVKPGGYDETRYFFSVPKEVKADKEKEGNKLTWYSSYDSKEGSEKAPCQNTEKEGEYHHYPSQTNEHSCEGDKDDVKIDIKNPVRHTYTHGFYGSRKGKVCYDGVVYKTPLEFLQKAVGLNNTISVGKANGEYKGSFTILYSQLVDLNKVLPFSEGKDESLNAHYSFSDFGKKEKQGKIRNPLISQLLAMALNLSADEKLSKNPNALGSMDLKNAGGKWIVTRKSASCITDKESECDHDGDDEERDSHDQLKSRYIPKSVIDALNASGKTSVKDLFEYASKGTFATGVSVSDVRKALAAINEAFEGGRYFVEYANKQKRESRDDHAAMQIGAVEEVASAMNNPKANVTVSTFPNPYTDKITFRLTAKQTGKATLSLYNLAGQRVATVFEGSMQANATQTIEYNVPSAQRGNLIFVFNNGTTNTTGKIVSARK